MPLLTTQSAKSFGWSQSSIIASDWEWIATGNGTGSSDSITFSSIPTTYKHLQIRGVANAAYGSADNGALGIRFNGDTGANYTRQGFGGSLSGITGTISQYYLTGTSFAQCGEGVYLDVNGSKMGTNIIDILDYRDTNKYKTVRGISGVLVSTTRGFVGYHGSMWYNTAAVTSITVFQQNASFGTATKFALYGLKG